MQLHIAADPKQTLYWVNQDLTLLLLPLLNMLIYCKCLLFATNLVIMLNVL